MLTQLRPSRRPFLQALVPGQHRSLMQARGLWPPPSVAGILITAIAHTLQLLDQTKPTTQRHPYRLVLCGWDVSVLELDIDDETTPHRRVSHAIRVSALADPNSALFAYPNRGGASQVDDDGKQTGLAVGSEPKPEPFPDEAIG